MDGAHREAVGVGVGVSGSSSDVADAAVMDLYTWGYVSLACLSSFIFFGLLVVFINTYDESDDEQYESEKYYLDPTSGELCPFPSLGGQATVDLSVIVPAYDEEKRLPPMLDVCIKFLEARIQSDPYFTYEVIIVDDGSKDGTAKLGHKYSAMLGVDKCRVLVLAENRGKGGAVKLGMYRSRGKYLLFADADGATTFTDLTKLECSMNDLATDVEVDKAVVVGSRAHLAEESMAKRTLARTILMLGFHLLVWLFCVRSIRDTQCGFKLLTRAAARACFPNLHIHGWAFDVELLYIVESLKIPVDEVAVEWVEIDGSKVVPFWSWLQMSRDLMMLWLRYTTGMWRIDLKRKVA